MHGLLITARMYFLDLLGRQKRDFAGWQINLLDIEAKVATFGEIKKLTFDRATEVATIECAWAARQAPGEEEFTKLVGADPTLTLDLSDHYGASHDDGGCHFDPGITASTKLLLHPPGTFDKSSEAATWARIKAVGTA